MSVAPKVLRTLLFGLFPEWLRQVCVSPTLRDPRSFVASASGIKKNGRDCCTTNKMTGHHHHPTTNKMTGHHCPNNNKTTGHDHCTTTKTTGRDHT